MKNRVFKNKKVVKDAKMEQADAVWLMVATYLLMDIEGIADYEKMKKYLLRYKN